MIARFLAAFLALAAPAAAEEPAPARIVYLSVADDPYYAPQPVYTGLSLRDREPPLAGARVAMRGARVLGRALGVRFELEETTLAAGEAPGAAIRAARAAGALAVILDLPPQEMTAAVAEEGAGGTILFNVRDPAARWRGRDCAPDLLHTIPARAMLADALAQYLRAQRWERVLLLRGPSEEDAAAAEAARDAIRKFGLRLADERPFELTNDPRRRDLTNIKLLTGGVRHDVVWLIDDEGEFGRYVPYATQEPRPVVGSEGLTPRAWHWTWERHGAPQLNQRFRRDAGRDMTSADWAGWVAVRAVLEAVSRVGAPDAAQVAAFLKSDALSLDLYKGAPGGFRDWDGQLRQPLLLATHNAVIARAPLEGFEHRTDTLDTLGQDRPETACVR